MTHAGLLGHVAMGHAEIRTGDRPGCLPGSPTAACEGDQGQLAVCYNYAKHGTADQHESCGMPDGAEGPAEAITTMPGPITAMFLVQVGVSPLSLHCLSKVTGMVCWLSLLLRCMFMIAKLQFSSYRFSRISRA